MADYDEQISKLRQEALAATPAAGVDWFRAKLLTAIDGWEAAARELEKLQEQQQDF